MKKLKNEKGFTLVELLAVIVVLAIVMSLAVVAITGVLDNARKATFVADAKSFLEGARNIVTSEEMNSLIGATSDGSYAVACDTNSIPNHTEIPLTAIKTQQGGDKSPYGNPYDKDNSKIYVTASKDSDGDCKYTYKIYLTDNVYAISDSDDEDGHNAVEWSALSTTDVHTVS